MNGMQIPTIQGLEKPPLSACDSNILGSGRQPHSVCDTGKNSGRKYQPQAHRQTKNMSKDEV